MSARDVIYLLVGGPALRIAFGDGKNRADRDGAVAEIARQPFGTVLLIGGRAVLRKYPQDAESEGVDSEQALVLQSRPLSFR
ncbi:DUF1206 domain-containing protein [Streptomyces sp. NPDC090798]|uniref:DUF1206 domain-containing protein n=1 Tax=Streptomyces sp. NPDC090798 TaxID=3365968 RepID=UPI0038282FA7